MMMFALLVFAVAVAAQTISPQIANITAPNSTSVVYPGSNFEIQWIVNASIFPDSKPIALVLLQGAPGSPLTEPVVIAGMSTSVFDAARRRLLSGCTSVT
jgi:hypothetical protein